MADYRIDAIDRELKEAEEYIYLMAKCVDVSNALLSIREDKSVVKNHSDKFITDFDAHIAAIVHDLYQISYSTNYEIDYTFDGIRRTLRNIEKDE